MERSETEDPELKPYHYVYAGAQLEQSFTSAVWYDTATPAQWCIRTIKELHTRCDDESFRIVSDGVEYLIDDRESFVVWVRDVFSADGLCDFSTYLE